MCFLAVVRKANFVALADGEVADHNKLAVFFLAWLGRGRGCLFRSQAQFIKYHFCQS